MSIREVIATINQMEADEERFQGIVRRYDLDDACSKFERQFLANTP